MRECAKCAELRDELERATEAGDHSRMTDVRVLANRHSPSCPGREAVEL